MSWWRWVRTSAETTHSIFLTKSFDQRESVLPTDSIPAHLAQVESWMRSRILACLLKIIRECVDLRATAGAVEPSHVLLYYLFKSFALGSPNEKDCLLRKVLNPNVCTQPQAARLELMRWRSDVLRLQALGCMPPDLTLSYRALESIFGVVFDQAEPQLHMRWIQLKNNLGLPHIISQTAFQQVSEFADAELSGLVLMGGTSLNPGLPLTQNQKKRLLDLKEGEKKRAAKAVDAAPAEHPPPNPYAARLSSSLSTWAILCKGWQNGECRRGVSCHFQHDGFPIEQKRCFTCK